MNTDPDAARPVARASGEAESIEIERLIDLEPYTDDIVAKINGDRRLALLAVADPVGALRDCGYVLSRPAARELRRRLPRLSRADRDRYLAWLRQLRQIPDSLDIKLARRPSGRALLARPAAGGASGGATVAGAGTAGFDVVSQFSEGLCQRLLQHHYAEGRLPRSVYHIGGKLHFFRHSGDYEHYRQQLGSADREIHFGQPTLAFQPQQPDRARVSSPFVAEGFGPTILKGVVTVVGQLAVKSDEQGHPRYVELSFANLQNNEVTATLNNGAGAPPDPLAQMLNEALRDFRQHSQPPEPHAPLTFTLVDGGQLAKQNIKPQPGEVQFAVSQPAGAAAPLLVVGFNRAERMGSGNLPAVPNFIKTGGEMATVYDAGWLEQSLNAGIKKALPVRLDPDSGKLDSNGDLKVESLLWRYREGGLSGNLAAVYEDAFLWVDQHVRAQVHIDITFHSNPHLTVEANVELANMRCLDILLRVLTVAVFVGIGIVLGAGLGGLLTSAIGAEVGLGLFVGGAAGAFAGLIGGLYIIGVLPVTFDPTVKLPQKQKMQLTSQQVLPESLASVTVIPNDYKVSAVGTAMSAKVAGPISTVAQPYVVVAGANSVTIADSIPAGGAGPVAPADIVGGEVEALAAGSESLALEPAVGSLQATVLGELTLHYHVVRTNGFQGRLSYLWSFRDIPLGTDDEVDVTLPLTASMLQGGQLEFNKVTHLGTLKLTVTDSFDRVATWSGSISIGHAKDLRLFAPQVLQQPGFIDPLEMVSRRALPPATFSRVAWTRTATGEAADEGRLLAYTTFQSPLSQDTFAVIGATTAMETLG